MKSGSLKEQVKNLTKSNLENIYDIEIKEFKSENEKHTTYVI
tara:strand:- start:271 stop:396 length:126 start_codon:yes stop_codon:yes gene_type:complete